MVEPNGVEDLAVDEGETKQWKIDEGLKANERHLDENHEGSMK